MRMFGYFVVLILLPACCLAQLQPKVGGPCQGCEAIHEYGNRQLTSIDTLSGFSDTEPKLKIYGTVFQQDGHTPAENVILYIYQTNRAGIYEVKGNETGWGRRHGHFRGWVKTAADGKYTFYTFRPGAYPNGREPQHIHLIVKEPDKNEYYLDSYLFTDDPMLTTAARADQNNRGGSGIVTLETHGELFIAKRNIILGLNIPHYD